MLFNFNAGGLSSLQLDEIESQVLESKPDETNANEITQEKLSVKTLLMKYDCLETFTKLASGRNRPFILCVICRQFEDVAKKHSRTHSCPFSDGVLVDSQDKLTRVIDHLESEQHRQAVKAKTNNELWKARSDRHEWRKYLNSENEYLVNELILMATDVYNDALHGTLSSH